MSLSADIRMLVQRPTIITAAIARNWNTGIATSGLAGADLFSYGTANQWWRLQEAYLSLFPGVWNIAAVLTIRVYLTLMGTFQLIASDNWAADGTDGNIAFIYWFWLNAEIFGPLRVELYSNVAADDGVVAPFEYRVKDW